MQKPRLSFWLAIAFIVVAVVARTFPFVWWPNAHFDSDQAIVGLMAKHISEGRAWPLYFYGQNYMLAVEPYLAAPVMWGLGATVLAVKLPLVLINVAAAVLLFSLLVREARLSPWVALVPVLPIALPAVVSRSTRTRPGTRESASTIASAFRARPLARSSMKLPGCETSAPSPSASQRRSSQTNDSMDRARSVASGEARLIK